MVDSIYENVDYRALADHYIVRDGFVFVPLTYPYDVFDAILIRNPQKAKCFSPLLPYSERSLDEHIALINELKLEKAKIIANNMISIRVPNSALLHSSVTYFKRLDAIGPAYYFSDLAYLNSVFR